jgi:hypothetical protein
MAQTVTVAATASEGSNNDWDNLAMAALLWLRRRYRKFPDCLHLLDVSHELVKTLSPAFVEDHLFVLFAACGIAVDGGGGVAPAKSTVSIRGRREKILVLSFICDWSRTNDQIRIFPGACA